MGQVIAFSPPPRARILPCENEAQILLFTGVWRERYETAPAIWSGPKRRAGPNAVGATTRGKPKGPTGPRRGKSHA